MARNASAGDKFTNGACRYREIPDGKLHKLNLYLNLNGAPQLEREIKRVGTSAWLQHTRSHSESKQM